jgi:hypothetical protein
MCGREFCWVRVNQILTEVSVRVFNIRCKIFLKVQPGVIFSVRLFRGIDAFLWYIQHFVGAITSKRPGWYLNLGAFVSENHEYYLNRKR